MISIPCLKYSFEYHFPIPEKINHIEIGEEYIYVSVAVEEPPNNFMPCMPSLTKFVGVDLNATGHLGAYRIRIQERFGS